VEQLQRIIDTHAATTADNGEGLQLVLAPITTLMDKYTNGMKGFRTEIINRFLHQYVTVHIW